MLNFDIIFLTEARKFLQLVDKKVKRKLSSILIRPKLNETTIYSKNLKVRFGNLELFTIKHTLDYFLFGIRKTKTRPWL